MTSLLTHLFHNTSAETSVLESLANKWEARCDVLRLNAAGSHAVNALDFELLPKLLLLLPYVINLITGGFTATAILGLLKQVIAMMITDVELRNILYQIMEVLVNLWNKQ